MSKDLVLAKQDNFKIALPEVVDRFKKSDGIKQKELLSNLQTLLDFIKNRGEIEFMQEVHRTIGLCRFHIAKIKKYTRKGNCGVTFLKQQMYKWRKAYEDFDTETDYNAEFDRLIGLDILPSTNYFLSLKTGKQAITKTGDDEWNTPKEFIDVVRKFFGGEIDLDPCSNKQAQKVIQAGVYWTKEDDCLTKKWFGNVFINPPYSTNLLTPIIDHLIANLPNTNRVLCLIHNITETSVFHKLMNYCNSFVLLHGRLSFCKGDNERTSNVRGSVLFYFCNDYKEQMFERYFSPCGTVAVPMPNDYVGMTPDYKPSSEFGLTKSINNIISKKLKCHIRQISKYSL